MKRGKEREMGRADLPRTHAGRRNPIVTRSEPQQPDPMHAAVVGPTHRGSAAVELPLALLAGSNASRRREDHPPWIHRPGARLGPPRFSSCAYARLEGALARRGPWLGEGEGGGGEGRGREWERRARRGSGRGACREEKNAARRETERGVLRGERPRERESWCLSETLSLIFI